MHIATRWFVSFAEFLVISVPVDVLHWPTASRWSEFSLIPTSLDHIIIKQFNGITAAAVAAACFIPTDRSTHSFQMRGSSNF